MTSAFKLEEPNSFFIKLIHLEFPKIENERTNNWFIYHVEGINEQSPQQNSESVYFCKIIAIAVNIFFLLELSWFAAVRCGLSVFHNEGICLWLCFSTGLLGARIQSKWKSSNAKWDVKSIRKIKCNLCKGEAPVMTKVPTENDMLQIKLCQYVK